jgi:hypothetical protein
LNRGASLFLDHARFETASLNHELVNHAVKYRVIVMPAIYIIYKILDSYRRFLVIEFEHDVAVVGVQSDHINPCFVSGWERRETGLQ